MQDIIVQFGVMAITLVVLFCCGAIGCVVHDCCRNLGWGGYIIKIGAYSFLACVGIIQIIWCNQIVEQLM